MSKSRHWFHAAVTFTAAFFAIALLLQALWIPLKAEVAQLLIAHSWQQALDGHPDMPPWPWADTRTLGILSVPAHNIRQMILEGNSGRNLAFGPVVLGGSQLGHDLVISGHRDTHFSFLRRLQTGDQLEVQLLGGTRLYEVSQLEIVDSRVQNIVIEPGINRLSLVTCYPFDAALAGGPLRYVVTALPAGNAVSRFPRLISSG